MPRHLRTLLILLLALPAVLVPRGVSLDWCLCRADASCCVDEQPTCCQREAPEPAGPTLDGREDCSCCKSVEVDEFDEVVLGSAHQESNLDFDLGPPVTSEAPVPAAQRVARLAPRAPPASVTPTGLLPGIRPLLL